MRTCACRHLSREGRRTRGEVAFDDAIDEPGAQRVGGLDRLAGDAHLDRLLETHEPRQSLRAFGARDDAEIHLGLSHLRVRHGDAVVPGHRDLEAAAERGAVHRHDDRLGGVFDLLQQLVHLRRAGVAAPRQLLESFDVGAGDERPARADDDDRLNRVVSRRAIECGVEAVDHLGTERVDGWVVDANERDALVDAECDGLIHMRRPASMPGTPIISP